MISRRSFITATAALAGGGLAVGAVGTASPASAAPAAAAAAGARPPLTNLDHLRWLLDDVRLVATATHTTIDIAANPSGLAPWTYANANAGGGWTRVGGGSLDAATGYWSQGAYNADDIARAAVVFVRAAAQAAGGALADARGLLRTLTYLQDASGPNAGNVALWMQADGTLNLTPQPPDSPNPSDSAESYWLARTLWAVGEGYAAFRTADPAMAAFLRDRLHLGLDALDRGCLSAYGRWLVADDVPVPAWLISGGADATAEACLGLAAYVQAQPDDRRARTALARLAEGVAAMRSGNTAVWPFGAILPWTQSQSFWHAWGGEAPQALCRTAGLLGGSTLRVAGLSDAGSFTPQVLTSGGPHNSWTPVPGEAQIAYGAEGRVSGLLAAADLTSSAGFATLAGLAGGWFFGANTSGRATYDPATGAAFDGVEVDGRINANSGAESTIHGLLAMLALDAHPEAAALASSITGYAFHGLSVLEAESGALSGGAAVVHPPSAWTGAANWSGGAYVAVPAGGKVTIDVSGHDGELVHPIVNRRPGSHGTSTYTAVDTRGRRTVLGQLENGGLGTTGVVQADGLLKPFALSRGLPAGAVSVVVETTGDLQLDALMLQPLVSSVAYARGSGAPAVLYASSSTSPTSASPQAPGAGWAWTPEGDRRNPVGYNGVHLPSGGFAITT